MPRLLSRTYASGQGLPGTDEETCANGTPNGNHVEVAWLHPPVEFVGVQVAFSPLERIGRDTQAGGPTLVCRAIVLIGGARRGVRVGGNAGGLLVDLLSTSIDRMLC